MNTDREKVEKFKTKQEFLRPKAIPQDILKEVHDRTKKEREWYANIIAFSEAAIEEAISRGKLVPVTSDEAILVAKTVEYAYVSSMFRDLLYEIARKLREIGEDDFLIIVSLLRSVEQQNKINPLISATSVHCKGEAVDFPGKWLETNEPKTAQILERILIEMKKEDKIEFIKEEHFGMWHIVRNPSYSP